MRKLKKQSWFARKIAQRTASPLGDFRIENFVDANAERREFSREEKNNDGNNFVNEDDRRSRRRNSLHRARARALIKYNVSLINPVPRRLSVMIARGSVLLKARRFDWPPPRPSSRSSRRVLEKGIERRDRRHKIRRKIPRRGETRDAEWTTTIGSRLSRMPTATASLSARFESDRT